MLLPRKNLMRYVIRMHVCAFVLHKKIPSHMIPGSYGLVNRIMLCRQRGENTVAIVRADPIGTIDTPKG